MRSRIPPQPPQPERVGEVQGHPWLQLKHYYVFDVNFFHFLIAPFSFLFYISRMATRSIIAIQDGDKHDAVYCHWDGYPSGVGATLEESYKDRNKIKELISRGDMSSLGPTIETCTFYTEKKEKVSFCLQGLKAFAKNCWAEYLYVFTSEDKWMRYNIR